MKLNCREKSRWSENSGERSEDRSQILRLPPSGLPPSALRQPASDLRPAISGLRESGVALVITLIMLSVITFMTVAFLVLSQRERHSVTGLTDQTISRFAVDSARERALGEMIAAILSTTNDQPLIVSTNFVNYGGFDTTFPLPAGSNPYTNVNFDYTYGLSAPPWRVLTADERQRGMQNLLINPTVPVYRTNRLTGRYESLAYLDLNRNGRFDRNGIQAVRNPLGGYYATNGTLVADPAPVGSILVSNFFKGDPEWIGILEFPDRPHSSSNRFIARIAYLVVPVSQTLDVNYIHNYSRQLFSGMDEARDCLARNQGVGTFEINLGAFFTDLNTNIWQTNSNPYQYFDQNFSQFNVGAGFDDALSILRYRYRTNYMNLLDPLPGLDNPSIDEYVNCSAAGATPMTGIYWNDDVNDDGAGFPGADNPRHIFTIQEIFDATKSSGSTPGLVSRIRQAGLGLSSYDSYTYYRMVEQLGTDSAPEPKLNVNYANVNANGVIVQGMETNLVPWQPLQFFTNAADRLLRAQFRRTSLTNISVFRNNEISYSPAVHRLLQLAANIFDATTNTAYPTMYRPYLSTVTENGTNNVIISGFELVDAFSPAFLTPPLDLTDPAMRAQIPAYPQTTQSLGPTFRNWYGVPWVIGARKGFPSFNELAVQSMLQVTRRLQVIRSSTTAPLSSYQIQQEFLIGVSNMLGVEFWNSYRTNFTIPVEILITGDMSYALTNSDGVQIVNRFPYVATPTNLTSWSGTGPDKVPVAQSFVVPFRTNFVILPNVAYRHSPAGFYANTNSAAFEPVFSPPVNWGLAISNRIRIVLRESVTGRLLDYVQLNGPGSYRNLSEEIRTPNSAQYYSGLWSTNLTVRGLPQSIQNQIDISLGNAPANTDWNSYGINQATGPTRNWEIDNFRAFYQLVPLTQTVRNTNLTQQVPFTPTVIASVHTSWQANDPLVHYIADDLNDPARSGTLDLPRPNTVFTNLPNIGAVNDRYDPWGGNPLRGSQGDPNALNLALKDPLVRTSDDWNFPTNRLPNVGWLGRVHRGTPWQTVYLKAQDTRRNSGQLKNWTTWSGSTNEQIARASAPVNDRLMFDVFSTAINENAVRGQLSINQPNLAAWSAVLSGVIVLTNAASDDQVRANPPAFQFEPRAIEPAGIYDPTLPAPVAQIVNAINGTRVDKDLFPRKTFSHLGDILSVTNLTEASPFLNLSGDQKRFGLTDEVYERIPQQIMSLLTLNHTPRFVIYAYGQTLHPAEGRSVLPGGQYAGLCTNYQITAESATRTVIRVEGSPDPEDNDDPDPARRFPLRAVIEQFNPLPPDL